LPTFIEGENLHSMLRMSRVISTLDMSEGTNWLFRLDRIAMSPGRVADRHQHPGPGIRCLLEGTFNVQQSAESIRECVPGDPWWETGADTVVAWGSRTMRSQFMRGMILPVEWLGKGTAKWLSGHSAATPTGMWKVFVDQIIVI
jgi:hypothetical protein